MNNQCIVKNASIDGEDDKKSFIRWQPKNCPVFEKKFLTLSKFIVNRIVSLIGFLIYLNRKTKFNVFYFRSFPLSTLQFPQTLRRTPLTDSLSEVLCLRFLLCFGLLCTCSRLTRFFSRKIEMSCLLSDLQPLLFFVFLQKRGFVFFLRAFAIFVDLLLEIA